VSQRCGILPAVSAAPPTVALLAEDRWRSDVDVRRAVLVDRPRRGAIALRAQGGAVRRAEPGPAGPLVLEARSEPGGVVLEVWGPPETPAGDAEAARDAAVGWAGLRDDLDGFADLASAHPVAREVLRQVGEPRLSRMPRVGEALGRAVLSQLIQGVEANRSIAQVAVLAGSPAAGGLWTWPDAREIAAVDAYRLRRCGLSLRRVRTLHEGALADRRLTASAAQQDWERLDRQLRTLPGCGAWTSAETRIALGDADAVSVGDYHHPSLVGALLGDRRARREDHDDAEMLELLAPFAPHRGRLVRMLEQAAARGIVSAWPRRGPRRALSAHRYW
jgi:3-methyladenine DNA glycosylase/8-oxoguanine DNA glycosylase